LSKICIINGPNLNLLGDRETDLYGKKTLEDIEREIENFAKEKKMEVDFFSIKF